MDQCMFCNPHLFTVIPILTGHMWFLTSCHLQANLWSKFHFDLCKVIFRQKIYKPCLILCSPMCSKPKNKLMLKTKACKNVPSSLELLSISTVSEETAHPTVYLHLSELSDVFIQLNYWLR